METEDKFYEKTLATTRTYTGKIVNVDVLDVELPDGRRAKREIVRRGNAVAILARRPDGKFVFVKQYRKAAEQGHVGAQLSLADCYANGWGVPKDPGQAAWWRDKATGEK